MSEGRALDHYLEHVAATHLPTFDVWFPSSFDYLQLCADVPAMARRVGHDVHGLAVERDLQEGAAAVFRASHLLTLALLCAAAEGSEDPEGLLAQLTVPLDEDDEATFELLVAEELGAVEEGLAASDGDAPSVGAEAEVALTLVGAIWPVVRQTLAADAGGLLERAGPAAEVLLGVGRVASILAAFRWMAAESTSDSTPDV